MRRIFLACFFVCSVFCAGAARAQTVASPSLLNQLLDLPAPPPVAEKWAPLIARSINREQAFYDKNKVPPDDAPIEDLLDYWSMQSRNFSPLRYKVKPSERTVERILEHCEENPQTITAFLNLLPRRSPVAESVKRIYDRLAESETPEYNTFQIRNWLVYNSTFFIDELSKNAAKVKDKDEYVTNQNDLLALARLDWERALPLLERLAGDKTQPVAAALAKWAYYARALDSDDDADITKYRRQLQDVVEDRAMLPGARDLAFDALVSEKDWDGRDEWYVELLSDETLFDLKVNGRSYTGLTTLILYSPPEKYVRTMATLVESKNPAVRRAAVKNLVSALGNGGTEAARALLPWASDPNWVKDYKEGRAALINALGRTVDLPESVPALINILMNEEEYWTVAAEALAKYKDSRAVPALKMALANEKNVYRRTVYIRALDECGGLTDDEKMSALEQYAATVATPDGALKFYNELYQREVEQNEKPKNPMPVELNIGSYVAELTEPPDGVVIRAVERLKVLRKNNPPVAAALMEIMGKWRGRIIFIERLRQIRAGEAPLELILTVLAQRREIMQKIESEVFAMRAASGVGRGIAACLAEDAADLQSVLRQTDADAKIAMLGCARLLRAALPVTEVGALLKSTNKLLALAAERYLESEDGVEARSLVLAHRPGEALILGSRYAFTLNGKEAIVSEPLRLVFQSVNGRAFFGNGYTHLEEAEEDLRGEIKANPDLLAIYGMLPNKPVGQQIVRVFKDKIVFTNYEDAARYRERTLTGKEYEDFYRLLLDEKIDSALPFFGYCTECEGGEFVMFGKNGGRRVFFTNASIEGSPVKKIAERFAFFNEGKLRLHYRLADKIKGLEVLLADEKFPARAVWKNGADLRVLVEDKEKEAEIEKNLTQEFEAENSLEDDEENYQRRQQISERREKRRLDSKYLHFFWRGFENASLGGLSAQPSEAPFLFDETQFPETPPFETEPRAWQVRSGAYEIRASHGEEPGLYKVSRGQTPIRLKEGNYDFPSVTPDGGWVVASKVAENWEEPESVVRINLRAGKEFPVNIPPADTFRAVAFVASHNKILLYRARGNKYYGYQQTEDESEDEEPRPNLRSSKRDAPNPSPATPEFYLLDAATGAVQPVKGEFRPLEDLTYRPLQPTGAPHEFWAAIYDGKADETRIGRYNTKTFAFDAVTKMPEIRLTSMDLWIDEKEAKIYFVYEGHFLVAPLLKN